MRHKLLMVAYACDPEAEGEYWLGWSWAEQAAKRYEVHLITPPERQSNVEKHARRCGIQAHFIAPPKAVAWTGKLVRLRGENLRMFLWQRRVARYAEKLHREVGFSLVHQTTFHSFRVPFLASGLGIPAVWGPIAGGEEVPTGFYRFLGPGKLGERFRALANRPCLLVPAIRKSFAQANLIFVSNRTTRDFLPVRFRDKYVVLAPNALRPGEGEARQRGTPGRTDSALHLLYAGWCVATRALPLAFEALVRSGITDYKFSILGDGPALNFWKSEAARLGIQDKITFTGRVPYAVAQTHYESADVLVFPSLRDSGGSTLLEAMARDVPVVCLDWGGPGEMLDADSGIKIPVTNPDETVRAFGDALARLKDDAGLRTALAESARRRAQALFRWEAKFDFVDSHYRRLIKTG